MTVSIKLQDNPSSSSEYFNLVNSQKFAIIDSFTLESGVQLREVHVGYKTWGKLNTKGTNCLVICHALSGSSDVEDWWGPLLGDGKAFDTSRYYVFCGNVMGSPYGSASPLSINPATADMYGRNFPQTTVRDDVRLHNLVLEKLNVKSVASVIGGSMGGMTTLEWPLCTSKGFVKTIIPIATSVDHSAWGISWAEAQRQCILADSKFKNGNYIPTPDNQPVSGLSAARIVAMLTYRSESSFDRRFSRRKVHVATSTESISSHLLSPPPESEAAIESKFSTQTYLKYQGDKFLRRFDANCYIHITQKMDKHDVLKGRIKRQLRDTDYNYLESLREVLSVIPSQSLVIGVDSDVLFTPRQQMILASSLPDAELVMLNSAEGHDGFLLEFAALETIITAHLRKVLPWIYDGVAISSNCREKLAKDSLFGEVESTY